MATLVTGGTGLIGASVARLLVQEYDERVVLLDRVAPQASPWSPLAGLERITYVDGTVSDLGLVMEVIKTHKIESIVHAGALVAEAASRRPLEALDVNIMGSAYILEAARLADLRRVVIISSSSVLGGADDLVTPQKEEELVLPPTGIYPLSKIAVEHLVHTYRQLYGVDTVALRPRTVYGPGFSQTSHFQPMPWLIETVCRGVDVIKERGLDTWYEPTYVKDQARGLVQALKAPGQPPHHVYNLSYGQNVSIATVVKVLRTLFPSVKIEIGPGLWEGVLSSGPQRDLTYRTSQRPPQDISRARSDFGFEPVWPVERAIPDFANWFRTGRFGDFA